jgi:hypothetical protein
MKIFVFPGAPLLSMTTVANRKKTLSRGVSNTYG